MRSTRATVLLTAGLVTLLGVPSAAAAEAPPSLYVNNYAGSSCADGGPGSQAVPFCTISAAAKVVAPGQTVRIKTGKTYAEAVTIDRSGAPGKPISFVADGPVGNPVSLGTEALTISGASHVMVRDLNANGGIRVNRSSDVELERIRTIGSTTGASLVVGEASTDVRVSRAVLYGVRIEGGAQRTVLSRNEIHGYKQEPLAVVDAPGTVITNNTFSLGCGTAVSLSGGSSGSAVFNNAINAKYLSGPCDTVPGRGGIAVSQSAAAGTRSDCNLIAGDFQAGQVYKWGGAAYQDQAAFHAATGQGGQDIVVPSSEEIGTKAVDSADATAPGVLLTDSRGYPVADDPRVPNTGKDGGYLDRGAREGQDWLESVKLELDQPWAPAGTVVKATATAVSAWSGPLTYHFAFGDGSAPVVTKERTATHVYSAPCECTATVTAYNDANLQAGAGYKAKVTAPGPLTAGFTSKPFLPSAEDPRAYVAPLTVEVDPSTSAAPWPVQQVDVDFGDGAKERVSALEPVRHAYAQPGEYKVTVSLKDAKGATSTVGRTVQVAYAASGYVPVAPFRALDTRSANTPVQAGTAIPVSLPIVYYSSGPHHTAGATAVVLNVTVTGATQDTHLNVWPSGQPRPSTSNVNVRAGGTSSNTVTVPVGADGKVLAQLNAGQGHVVVDFVGYYQPNTGQRFYPVTPTRLADTRTAGGALGTGQTRTVKVAGVRSIPPDAAAVALNLTSTGATTDTHVIAYPDPAKRPTTSNLNPEPGKDKSNQVIVPVGPDGTITLYNNAGSTDLVLDVVGYYHQWGGGALFTPVVPKRLADTRTTAKLAPGETSTVAGLPAHAVGAALNVTATETTGAGFLTVHGYGTARTDASSLNTRPGETVPNHVITPVGDGKVSIWNSWGGSNHVITDLFGYFTQG
ncbi:PKD domain-containing protein [Streptomyces sp. NBC_01233]|uniref:PKD domain-containing protein n=1 Tax=Streptomyces sp. NBC_01233 TaxID=2903787 RepID=UPI002E130E30|nr:PKD domain-containing protein [Streptomyces sp. NBC_01233]